MGRAHRGESGLRLPVRRNNVTAFGRFIDSHDVRWCTISREALQFPSGYSHTQAAFAPCIPRPSALHLHEEVQRAFRFRQKLNVKIDGSLFVSEESRYVEQVPRLGVISCDQDAEQRLSASADEIVETAKDRHGEAG